MDNKKSELEKHLYRGSAATYRQFRFRNIIIFSQFILLFLVISYLIYDKINQQIYTVIEGVPYAVSAKNEHHSVEQVYIFLKEYLTNWVVFTTKNYKEKRNNLISLSSPAVVSKIKLNDLKKGGIVEIVRKSKGLIKSELGDFRIDEFKSKNFLFEVDFSFLVNIVSPDSIYSYTIKESSVITTVKRSIEKEHFNPYGLKMIALKERK